jgi:hypothetical protein
VRNPSEDLKELMRSKTDEELYFLMYVDSQDYTPEAIKAAREEFDRRKLDGPTMNRIRMAAVFGKALEERNGKHGGPERKHPSDAKETATSRLATYWRHIPEGVGCLVLIGWVGAAIYGGYGWLDSMGWTSHREDTAISARSDWLVGESKECWSATLNSDGAAFLKKEVGYAMSSVSCDDGPQHEIAVTFYGRKVQPEYKAIDWRCTRNSVSFTCYQTGGQR